MAQVETRRTVDGGYEHRHVGRWVPMDTVETKPVVLPKQGQSMRLTIVCRECPYILRVWKPET
jgi:hypothetical protein